MANALPGLSLGRFASARGAAVEGRYIDGGHSHHYSRHAGELSLARSPSASSDGNLVPGPASSRYVESCQHPSFAQDEPADEACAADVVGLLRRYEAHVRALLAKHSYGVNDPERVEPPPDAEARIASLQEDDLRVREAHGLYRAEIAEQHDRWMHCEAVVAEADETVLNMQVEGIVETYLNHALRELGTAVQRKCKARLAALSRSVDASSLEAADATAAAAQEGFAQDICHDTVTSMRYEWRQEQRKVLQWLAREMQSQRRASLEMLGREERAFEEIDGAVTALWHAQAHRVQTELDKLLSKYKTSVRKLYEAKLREIRVHAEEQADFFQREIREAFEAEEEERKLYEGHLRKMRLALVKWRHDYIKDARSRAFESGQRKLAADEEDNQSFSDVEEAQMEDTQRRLADCRLVLTKVWEHLPVDEESRRDFLSRLSERIPYTERVRVLYEAHLSEHGVLVALDDCDDGVGAEAGRHEQAACATTP